MADGIIMVYWKSLLICSVNWSLLEGVIVGSVIVSFSSWNHKVLEGIEDLKEIKSSCRP